MRLHAPIRELQAAALSGEQARLLEFHHLVRSVTNVEFVIESLAGMHLAMVVCDQLAYVRCHQSLGCLLTRHFDVARLHKNAAPVLRRPIQP